MSAACFGAAFNWGIIMAYTCLQNKSINTWVLYLVAVFWTISYDTIYAMADIVDDKRLRLNQVRFYLGKCTIMDIFLRL